MQKIRHGTTRLTRVLFAAALVSGTFACSALRRPPPPVDRSQDARIISEVEARIAAEPAIDASLIRVEADGGVVMLYGSVSGIGQWQCAIRNAELVEGVRTVVDYLVLERGPTEVRCLAPRPTGS